MAAYWQQGLMYKNSEQEGDSLNSFFEILTEWEEQLKYASTELLSDEEGLEE